MRPSTWAEDVKQKIWMELKLKMGGMIIFCSNRKIVTHSIPVNLIYCSKLGPLIRFNSKFSVPCCQNRNFKEALPDIFMLFQDT